ncbi:MAG: GFA family protein [Microcoleaceae cyanobacterium]
MTDQTEQQASCLCGAVRIFVKPENNHVGACHCKMCRRWSSGPLFAMECGDQVRFEGRENITTFSSSEWAERGFCNKCGSNLFYRIKQTGDYFIPVGILDDESQLSFKQQIFIDQKPAFYSFANQTENLTEAEVLAQYSQLLE